MPDRSSPAQAGPEQPANISITNRREPNSPRLISRLKPAPTYLLRAMQTLTPDPFCPLTDPQPYQREKAQPPLVAPNGANIENCFTKSNLDFTADSGLLHRLVRRGGFRREIRLTEIAIGTECLKVLISCWTAQLPCKNVVHLKRDSGMGSRRATALATPKIVAEQNAKAKPQRRISWSARRRASWRDVSGERDRVFAGVIDKSLHRRQPSAESFDIRIGREPREWLAHIALAGLSAKSCPHLDDVREKFFCRHVRTIRWR